MIGKLWNRGRRQRDALSRRRALFQPRLESLESRLALAAAIWDGGGGNNNWSSATNWVGDVAPAPGDDLLFPGSANRTFNVNDFVAGTTFGTITFAGSGYSISGNAIALGNGLVTINASGNNTVSAPLVLNGPQTITSTYTGTTLSLTGGINLSDSLTVGGSGDTSVSGVVSGSGGLEKNGVGTLRVDGALLSPNTYAGETIVNEGVLNISGFGDPLGSTLGGTTVNVGATLQVIQQVTINEPLLLNGYGIRGDVPGSTRGALEIGPPSTTTITGAITLGSDASIGINSTGSLTVNTSPITLDGHKLTINAAGNATIGSSIVDGAGGSGSLAINTGLVRGTEYGTIDLTAANFYTGSTLINAGVLKLSANGTLSSSDIQLAGAPGNGSSNGFQIPGGVLRLDNAQTLNADRVPDNASITFNGGAFHYIGSPTLGNSTEAFGSLHFASGHSFFRTDADQAAGAGVRLTGSNIVRDPGATVDFSGNSFGTAKNRLFFSQSPTKVGNGGGILPYATVTTLTKDFATYNSNGLTLFTGYVPLATAGPDDIAIVTESETVTANKTVTALLVSGGPSDETFLTIDPGVTLNVGQALLTTGLDVILEAGEGVGDAPQITFASAGIIHRGNDTETSRTTTIRTAIGGNTSLTLSGLAPLILEPPLSGNSYSGGLTLNSGRLVIEANNTPFGAATGPVKLHGGTLGVSVLVGPITVPNPLVLSSSNPNFEAISTIEFSGLTTLTGRNILAVPGNVTLHLSGKVTGSGSLVLTAAMNSGSGGGKLTLSNAANDYSGGTILVNSDIFTSTLELGDEAVLGTGAVLLSNGNIQATVPVIVPNTINLVSSVVVFTGDQSLEFAGPVNVDGINRMTRGAFTGSGITISGQISGPGAIIKEGDYSLFFENNNTHTGSTVVLGGTLMVLGDQETSPIALTGGILAGTGSVGHLSVSGSGVVSPGSLLSMFGQLTALGANFSSGGTLLLNVGQDAPTGIDFDQLLLGDQALVLGGSSSLRFDLLGLIDPRRVFGLVRYGSRPFRQDFANISLTNNPNGFQREIEYTAKSLNSTFATESNDPPDITSPVAISISEDALIDFSVANGNAIAISDPDSADYPVRLSLTASQGNVTLASTEGLSFITGDGTADPILVFTGTVSAINVALDGMQFRPAANYSGTASLSINLNDRGYFGLGGEKTANAVVNINVAQVNDAGSVVISGSAKEHQTLTAIVSDADGLGVVSYQWQRSSPTGFVDIVGATNNTFQPDDPEVGFQLRVRVNYVDNQGFSHNLVSAPTAAVVGINDRPVVANIGSNLVYREGAVPIVVASTATVSDVDSPNFNGGKLVVKLTSNGHADDRLAIRTAGIVSTSGNNVLINGLVIGTFTGGAGRTPLEISLNQFATPARVQVILRAIVFSNVSNNPTILSRTLVIQVIEADGVRSLPVTKLIQVAAVNDAPVISVATNSPLGYQNRSPSIQLLGDATLSDPDSLNFAGGLLLVSITSGAHSSNRLFVSGPFSVVGSEIRLNGQTIGLLNSSGGEGATPLRIRLQASATRSVVQTLLNSIRFRTTSDASTAQRVISFSVSDGDGKTSNIVTKTVNVS